ncbi:MAG TPA: ATP-binding protein [Aggregatilineaceae bacterium]|nr:ATP-binding protein [Aggregatilineaceae bacterium]
MAHRLRRLHWLTTAPLQAWIEGLIIGLILLVFTWIARHHITAGERQDSLFVALLTTISWYAIRLRKARGNIWQFIGFELGVGLFPAIVAGGLIWEVGTKLLPGIDRMINEPGLLAITGSILDLLAMVIQGEAWPSSTVIPTLPGPPAATTMFISGIIAVIVSRGFMLFWQFWARLRRRHLIWALTHSHLMLVVLGLFLFAAITTINTLSYQLSSGKDLDLIFSITLTLIPLVIIMGFLTVILLLIVLPPALALSYIAARHTTRRLRPLTGATTRLRQGDYSARVLVQGEDEVAALQAGFNAMAQDLERAIHDVQTERDHVEKLLRNRRELIASVSHELRTPVAVLYSYLESTQSHWQNELPEELKRDFETMESETKQLQRLLDDLFALSRAEVGELTLACQPIELQGMIRRAVAAVAPVLWQTAKVELVIDLPALLPRVLVDEMRLEQILHNLLRNSARHTPPGGIIAVTAAENGDQVVMQVQDTGEGIAPEHLPHIWERFYRVDSAGSYDQGRTGLGLALVKELTEAMGGRVDVTSTPGQGSIFFIFLPRA